MRQGIQKWYSEHLEWQCIWGGMFKWASILLCRLGNNFSFCSRSHVTSPTATWRPACYLPTWLSYMFKIREMILNPRIDVLQGHALLLRAVDGKLDHGHVGVRRSFWYWILPWGGHSSRRSSSSSSFLFSLKDRRGDTWMFMKLTRRPMEHPWILCVLLSYQ